MVGVFLVVVAADIHPRGTQLTEAQEQPHLAATTVAVVAAEVFIQDSAGVSHQTAAVLAQVEITLATTERPIKAAAVVAVASPPEAIHLPT